MSLIENLWNWVVNIGPISSTFQSRKENRMKRMVSVIALLVTLWVVFTIPNASAAQKPIELSYSIFFPATHKITGSATEWSKEIEKRTNGRVKITVFPGGTLTPPDKCYDGVVKGISDIGMSFLGYTKGRFPLSEVIDLPLGCRSGLMAAKLINDFYKKFRPKEFDDTKVLYLYGATPYILHTVRRPVHKLEDLKGLKIRSTGPSARVVSVLGGAPVAMPMTEAYDSLTRGVVDGILAPWEPLVGFKLAEVLKYSIEYTGATHSGVFFVVINKEKWNTLPPDIQNIMDKVSEEWIEKSGKLWDDMDKAGRDLAVKLGIQIITLPKEEDERWAKAVTPLLAEYVGNMKAKALPGEEALQFCQNYLKTHQ